MLRRGAMMLNVLQDNCHKAIATKQELLHDSSPAAGLVRLVTFIQPVNLDLLCFPLSQACRHGT